VPTFGKTTISLYIAQQLGLKTLVVVHKSFLQNQWYDRIKQFTNAKIGMIRQNKVDTKDKDIVVAMLHSISMKDYDLSIFDQFGCVIFDECFVRRTRVITSNGSIQIGQLYDMWTEGEELPLIKSFNEQTEQFEFKRMTYAWKKEAKNLVKVKMGKRSTICTLNHRFLTINGYKEARSLGSNDILIGIYDSNIQENAFARALNDDQIQIVLGSFLGDGGIDTLESGRYRLREIHGIEQRKYCEWKASMFGITDLEYIEKNGYAQKPAVRFQTRIFDFENTFPQNKSVCPQWIINQIDWRAIAIWIMDDGSMNKKSPHITISTCSFDEDSQTRLVARLSDLGVPSYYYKDKRGHFYISINEKGTKKVLSEIYKYIHPSMMSKLITKSLTEYIEDIQRDHSTENTYHCIHNIPIDKRVPDKIYYGTFDAKLVKYLYKHCSKCDDHRFHLQDNCSNKRVGRIYTYYRCISCKNSLDTYTYNITLNDRYIWNNEFLAYATCKVSSVKKQMIKDVHKYVYDIEVEDNHNFTLGSEAESQTGPVVHNCHHLGAKVFSKAMMKTGGHYTIGLSATPQRSDGLTKVINWYLGDIIYRIVRKGDKNVAVRMFNYDTKDKLFVEKKQYIKGKTVLSLPRMITNLGKITGRNKFIIDILNKLKNEDERKILVLSNRIAHLELLKDELDKEIKKDIEKGTLVDGEVITAFYIGRMKDLQLTLAAEADVIFASYAMAEEGLDIDKLNTLVLATPKKNIIQSIGRILRKPIKEGDINPLIIDIVDELSIFSSWGNKRQEYYTKEGYKVDSYQAMNDKCISVKDYLVKKGVISSSDADVDLRKEFICYKYGQESWELEQDLMSDDEKDLPSDPKYTIEPNLDEILKITIEI
jgi:superfamily II DNA or RNA helicase